jgi:hypothetical protein
VLELFIALLQIQEPAMAKPSKTSRPREAPSAEAATRIAPHRRTADRRLRIQERLTMGLTVAHIARVEQVTVRRVRQIIAEMLASREIDPPAGFVQLQIARLSEAMIVARTMMMQGNLQAMDRFMRLTSELDRYHGFAPAQIPWAREAAPPRLAAPEPRAISPNRGVSLAGIAPREGLTAKWSRPEMAPQRLEKIESAPGNGMVSEALNPQDVVHGRARLGLASRENDAAKFSVSQSIEIARNREGISESAPRISPPRFYEEGSGVGLFGPVDEALEVPRGGARPTPSLESGGGEVRGEVEGKFSASQGTEIARNRERISPTPARQAVSLDVAEFDPRGEGEGKFSASQSIEIARNRESLSETPVGAVAAYSAASATGE